MSCLSGLAQMDEGFDSTTIESRAASFDVKAELEMIQKLIINEVNLDSLIERAYANSAQLAQSQTIVDQQEQLLRVEQKSWMRSLQFGVNFFNISTRPSGTVAGAAVTHAPVLSNIGLSLSVNPADIFSRNNRIKVAAQEVEVTKLELEKDKLELKVYITRKFLEYQEALELYILRENSLMIAEENLVMANEKFKQGRMQSATYNVIMEDLMLKKQGLIKAETQVLLRKSELEIFTGIK
jgi:outer membrane protein TolC